MIVWLSADFTPGRMQHFHWAMKFEVSKLFSIRNKIQTAPETMQANLNHQKRRCV